MQTFGDLVTVLNRPAVYLRGLQSRFELPAMEGAGYSDAYLTFLRKLVYLRTLSVSEDALLQLWHLEKKLMKLLYVDSAGSPTWFLDACGPTSHRSRRLLLSNHDLGVALPSHSLQLGFDFGKQLPELFAGREMGEDALRVLESYLVVYQRIRAEVQAELPLIRNAVGWARRFK